MELTGRLTEVHVRATDTMGEVMRFISEARDIPKEAIRLIFGGKSIEDSNTVNDYNIQEGSRLHMVLRIR